MAGRGLQKDSGDDILSEINVVPLVDISLVLLIIFMVTANYIMASSFAVDIPKAGHAKPTQELDIATISISREGPLYLEDELVTVSELKSKMQAIYEDNPAVAVVISADKNVNFRNVVQVLDLLSELGITKLNLAAAVEQ